jgi:drug/metabolite transporter (DMT)-like permease
MSTKSTDNPSMNAKAWFMLIVLAVLWGGSFFFVEIAVEAIPTFSLVLLRVGLGAFGLWCYLLLRRRTLPWRLTFWWPFFVIALLNNAVPFSLLVWGQSHIAGGLASILNATTPFFAVIVASLLVQEEKLTLNRVIGATIGFMGVAVLIGPDILSTLGDSVLAQIACLGAALSYAFAGVFARKSSVFKTAPDQAATAQLTAATVLLLPVTMIADSPNELTIPSFSVVCAILSLGFLATSCAYVVYFKILATAGAVNLLLVTFLVPVTAMFLGIAVLGEVISETQVLGAVAIGIALSVIDGRLVSYVLDLLSPHRRKAS